VNGNTGITGITGITSEYRKIQSFLPPGFRFKVRVLIRFTCDSYVFAYVVHCILRYSDVIPVIPVFPYTLHPYISR